MSTYTATGINLRGMPLGENDRLLTILTAEHGMIRAVAPGARKHKSRLRGRSELFVVNQLLLARGRSLDRITQAETLESYPKLSRNLGKLAASQYLAELALFLAPNDHPQPELYPLVIEHLRRFEQIATQDEGLLAHLAQATFHLLAVAGIAPQVTRCCLNGRVIALDFSDRHWRVGFSFEAGGVINLGSSSLLGRSGNDTMTNLEQQDLTKVNTRIGAVELALLQNLSQSSLPQPAQFLPATVAPVNGAWARVERLLREYVQYHCGRPIRSAALVDAQTALDF